MTEERFRELLNKEIDGLNVPRESEELLSHVQSDPGARALYQDLLKISTVLARVEEVDPPASLRSEILTAVRASRRQSEAEFSILGWLRELVESRTSFQYAYVFSAGLILGIAIYSMVAVNKTTNSVVDPSSVSGAIILDSASLIFSDGVGYSIDLGAQGMSGKVTTKYSNSLAVIEIDFNASQETEIILGFNPASLRFKGFSQSQPTTGNRIVGERSFRLTTQGENHYILAFERVTESPAEVTFAVERQSTELHRQSLLLAGQE